MRVEDRNALLQATARTLAWELFAASGYGRLRVRIDVEHFGRELRSAVRQWSVTNHNLTTRKEP